MRFLLGWAIVKFHVTPGLRIKDLKTGDVPEVVKYRDEEDGPRLDLELAAEGSMGRPRCNAPEFVDNVLKGVSL